VSGGEWWQQVNGEMGKTQGAPSKFSSVWTNIRIPLFHYSTIPLFLTISLFHYFTISPSFAAFEPLGYGAAAKGMGGAYSALAEDGSAAYWNPAGLAFVKAPHITSAYEDLYGLGLLRYTGMGYTQPKLGGGTASFQYLRLQTVGEASFFTYAENTYLLAYGRHLYGPLFGGVATRFYSANSEQKASAIGYDAGLMFSPSLEDRFRLSVALQDANEPRLRWNGGATDVLAPTLRTGALLRLGPVSDFTAEHSRRRREKSCYRAGMAHHLMGRRFVLRAGVHKTVGQDSWNLALGGGLSFKRLRLDYAWDHHETLGDSQTFSLSFRFGP